MLLNAVEFGLMNNAVRAWIQRRFEAARLLEMGGRMHGGVALELGCGRGVGIQVILDLFGAGRVHAFDLDPRMARRSSRRVRRERLAAQLFIGDCTSLPVPAARYDAVFDFGIIHHVPDWRAAIQEVARVLKPGGRFYAEEILRDFILHPLARRVLDHPEHDRFDALEFQSAIAQAGLRVDSARSAGRFVVWVTATKP